jgi:hypothetical protein
VNEFDEIYMQKRWGNGTTEPLSGRGSMAFNSIPMIEWILDLGPDSICDIGCGDQEWIRSQPDMNELVRKTKYVGIDVSRFVLGGLTLLSSPPLGPCILADASLPGFYADAELIVCKDVCMHLSDERVEQLLHNISQSHYQYLILNTDAWVTERPPMNSACWSPVNLERFPVLAACGKIVARAIRPEHGEYLLIKR